MADNMLYTIGGYAVLIGVGYVVYHVSTQNDRKRAGVTAVKPPKVTAQAETRKEDRKKKQRMDAAKAKANASASAPAPAAEPAWLSNASDDKPSDDKADNLKFARQLAKAQEGTKFSNKSDGGKKQREKSVKQSRANKIVQAANEKESAASSTGADADDDQSPITSPEVGPATAGDVSDMLESVPARPAVLRVTEPTTKQEKQKAAKAPEPVETKKQRQNRKKAEAAKVAREEAEKERKVLEEKQRRTARIAEGRAAKDGSQFMAANGTKSSWTEGAPKDTKATKTNGFHQPLDTVEPSTSTKPKDSNWISTLPSEEEQMEMLKSDEDDWSMVKTKSSKRAAKNESPVDSGDEPSRSAAQPKKAVEINASKSKQSFGAFSALSKNEPAEEEEEEEEEWDV